MWVIVLYILGGLILLCILLLCIPIEITCAVDTSADEVFRLKSTWFYGLVKKDIRKPGGKTPDRKETSEKRPGRLFPDTAFMQKIIDARELLVRFKNLAVDIFRQISIKEISGDFIIGMEDPALTGMLFAAIGPANAVFNLHPKYNVRVTPYFEDEDILEGQMYGIAKVRPISLVVPAIRFGSSREVIRTEYSFIKNKWKQKK